MSNKDLLTPDEMAENPKLAYIGGAQDTLWAAREIVRSRQFSIPETAFRGIMEGFEKLDRLIKQSRQEEQDKERKE